MPKQLVANPLRNKVHHTRLGSLRAASAPFKRKNSSNTEANPSAGAEKYTTCQSHCKNAVKTYLQFTATDFIMRV